eukprot:TRINITY_DN6359_c0_g1_i1.p1 TRINITY_DN6359_c0_g1~~TRINITY_DN6359_c0_g1_i1.p1  ORF type:complete len:411 (+),score=133.98 TRINITY_DN6359_c0_g1_i1:25-1257(+)
MASKEQKPQLAGVRTKAKKRDVKVKFDPTNFRDELVDNINGCENVQEVTEYLETAGNNLDYRRYYEQFFDILVAGGMLAPGGSIVADDGEMATYCVFACSSDDDEIKQYSQMFDKVLRRYKYMQVLLEDHITRVLKFVKAFEPEQRTVLAKFVAQIMAGGDCSSKPLSSLFLDQLVKDGLAESFMFDLFRGWLAVSSINSLATSFRKSGMDAKLELMYPINKRSQEHLLDQLKQAEGLEQILSWQNSQRSTAVKNELSYKLIDAFKAEQKPSEVNELIQQTMKEVSLKETDVVTLLWTAIMESVEWNKKQDLVAEQALRQVHKYIPLLRTLTSTGKAQSLLMVKIQNYCFDNQNLLKVFVKIIMLLYHHEVLEEDSILEWYNEKHSSKGRSVFLEQSKDMVNWLQTAEVQ